MRVAQKFAGYSLAEADNLRKAMGKKIREVMAKERGGVRDGLRTHRLRQASSASSCSTSSSAFADYAFNKSHTLRLRPRHLPDRVPQGALPGRVLRLPAHERQEQPRQGGGVPRRLPGDWASRCSRPTSTARSPTSPRSIADDVPPTSTLPAGSPGRDHVRAVGGPQRRRGARRPAARRARRQRPVRQSFHDFAERVPEPVLNKRTVESLIKAGAFDTLGHPRRGLLMVFEQIIDTTLVRRRERDQGVMSLFGDVGDASDATAVSTSASPSPTTSSTRATGCASRRRCSACTSATTRCSASRPRCAARSTAAIAEALEREDGAHGHLGGVITDLSRKFTKKGDQMAVFVLEDLDGAIEVTVFPRALDGAGPQADRRLDRHGQGSRSTSATRPRVGFMAQDIQVVEGLDTASAPSLRLRVPATSLNELRIHQLRKRSCATIPATRRCCSHIGHGQDVAPGRRVPCRPRPRRSASCEWPSATTP